MGDISMRVLSNGFSSTLYAFLIGADLVNSISKADIIVDPKDTIYFGKKVVLLSNHSEDYINELKSNNEVIVDEMNYSTKKIRGSFHTGLDINSSNINSLRCLERGGILWVEIPLSVANDKSPIMEFLSRVLKKSTHLYYVK